MAWHEKVGDQYRGRYLDAKGEKRTAINPATGKKLFRSKRAAVQAAQDQEAKIRGGAWVDPQAGMITFRDYFNTMWRPNKVGEINTLVMYDSHFKCSLEPEFGDLPLRMILPSTVQGWVKRQQEAGVSAISIEKRFRALQTILAGKKGVSAIRDQLITANPCAGTELPTVIPREVTIYTPDEVDALMEQLDPYWVPLIAGAVDLGVRWGELMGLRVDDFTFGFKTVTVRRTVVQVSKRYTGNGTRFALKEYPKGRRWRTLAVSPDVAEMLAYMVAELELGPGDRLFSMPDKTPPPDWQEGMPLIWTPQRDEVWPDGIPVSRDYFRNFIWNRAIEQAGVPKLRIHDLRASNITWLLHGTQNVAMVMDRVGHVHFSTTKRYIGKMREADEEAVNVLASVRKQYSAKHRNLPPGQRRRIG